ncbi:signal recognition particle protein Srp19 [Candidatus Bathyarchaeota archaeon]|nr:MAG: signal recognition particle protein Srp19 [Candidatus Bathyarchaeota archaeon]
MRRRKGMCVLWPIYFDANESRRLRRVPRELAIPDPKLEELCLAVGRLGLRYEVVEGAAHPSRHWAREGYLLVEKRGPKGELVKKVALALRRMRSSRRGKA